MNSAFIIGVDRAKMRLYDVENNAQNIVDANQTQTKENYPTPDYTHMISFQTLNYRSI